MVYCTYSQVIERWPATLGSRQGQSEKCISSFILLVPIYVRCRVDDVRMATYELFTEPLVYIMSVFALPIQLPTDPASRRTYWFIDLLFTLYSYEYLQVQHTIFYSSCQHRNLSKYDHTHRKRNGLITTQQNPTRRRPTSTKA